MLFVLQATIFAVEDLLSATIYDLCCSKALLPWTIFELGDDRMSFREFCRHISTCRNVYCKLCGCSTSLKFLQQINDNNRPPTCMSKPFPGRGNRKFIWSGHRCQSSHIIYQFICYCSYRKGISSALSAISSILHQSGTQFVNLILLHT